MCYVTVLIAVLEDIDRGTSCSKILTVMQKASHYWPEKSASYQKKRRPRNYKSTKPKTLLSFLSTWISSTTNEIFPV
jgi:hypothetical protein